MSRVTVVGAVNVGATCANVLSFNEVADEVVTLDVKERVSEGKAMDMMQTAQRLGFDTTVVGCTNDYEKTANSDVVAVSYTHLITIFWNVGSIVSASIWDLAAMPCSTWRLPMS